MAQAKNDVPDMQYKAASRGITIGNCGWDRIISNDKKPINDGE